MFAWEATVDDVAALMPDRLAPTHGRFTEATTPTGEQVARLLAMVAPKVLVQVCGRDQHIPESCYPLARLAHAQLVASYAENQYGEQVEQTSRATFMNINAKDTLAVLTDAVKTYWNSNPDGLPPAPAHGW